MVLPIVGLAVFGALISWLWWRGIKGKKLLVFSICSFAAIAIWLWHAPIKLYSEQKNLRRDVELLLDTGDRSPKLSALPLNELLNSLVDYGWYNPMDTRVWKRIASLMVNMAQREPQYAPMFYQYALAGTRRLIEIEPGEKSTHLIELGIMSELQRLDKIELVEIQYKLNQISQRRDLSPQEQIQLASLAQEFKLDALSLQIYEQLLAAAPAVKSNQARQGQQILEKLIAKQRAKLTQGPEIAKPNVASNEVPSLRLQISLDETAKRQLRKEQLPDNALLLLWVSMRGAQAGPPLAAKQLQIRLDKLMNQSATIKLTQAEQILPDRNWNIGDRVQFQARLGLDAAISDPLLISKRYFAEYKTELSSDTFRYELMLSYRSADK